MSQNQYRITVVAQARARLSSLPVKRAKLVSKTSTPQLHVTILRAF